MNNIKKQEYDSNKRILIPLILLSLILTFTCIGAVSAAPGDAIYVNGSGGNDNWDGQSDTYNSTTGSGPKLSIKNATGTVNSNGIVHIADGVYTGTDNRNITIDKNMNIIGQSQSGTIINAQHLDGIFIINGGATVNITNLTLTNGTTTHGGAIYNQGTLTVNNSTLTNNIATGDNSGGAICNDANDGTATLNIANSTLNNNIATGYHSGGAICNDGDGGTATLNIANSTLNNNIATGFFSCGAIYNYGRSGTATLNIANSTLNNNTATGEDSCGAIYNYGFESTATATLNIANSTLTNNIATGPFSGGAIRNNGNEGTANVHFNRIVGNTATGYHSGGAIYNGGSKVDADNNWWGSNNGPYGISGYIIATKWIILTTNATPIIINNTQISTITADLNHVNGGDPLTGGRIPDGPITFSSTLGSVSPVNTITSNGQATATFTPTCYSGIATVNATVDGFSLGTPVTVTNAEIYVSNNTGSDVTGDGSSGNPYQTILKGINWVSLGGNVHIADGVYTGVNNTGITIDKNMNIIGQSQAGTVIDGSNTVQIFNILSGVNVTIRDLTLSNGHASNGAAIYNKGNLTITNSAFNHNTAYNGGGILNYYGNLTIANSTFSNNTANYGGAIYNYYGGTLIITNSTLNNNTADYGGSIYNMGTSTIANSTFYGNTANNNGGAIYNDYGTATISNTTINNNRAAYAGGAIYTYYNGILTIVNSMLYSNTATIGGAMCNIGGTVTTNFNRIVGNTANQGNAIYNSGGTVNAEKNWWGSNDDPKTISNLIFVNGGSVNTNTWVILTVNATPNTINNGQTTNITADFNHINGGGDLTGGHIPEGTVDFTTDWGSLNQSSATTVDGEARTTFQANGTTSPTTNPVKVYAAADSEISTYAPVTIVIPTKLVLNEATAYKGKTIKLTATLWDTFNKAISGQSVTFKINGKVVGSANTNANGVATLAYKDLTGKSSTITAEFAGSSQYVSSNNTNQLVGEKTFTLTVKNTGKSRIHLIYYVTVYKPNNAKPIYKKYKFYLNPGKTKKINIGTYPIGTAVSSDQFIYNTLYTNQKVSLSNTWTAKGLKVYTQKFMVKNVPSKQKRAVYAKNRFWINKNALNALIVKKPRIR